MAAIVKPQSAFIFNASLKENCISGSGALQCKDLKRHYNF